MTQGKNKKEEARNLAFARDCYVVVTSRNDNDKKQKRRKDSSHMFRMTGRRGPGFPIAIASGMTTIRK